MLSRALSEPWAKPIKNAPFHFLAVCDTEKYNAKKNGENSEN